MRLRINGFIVIQAAQMGMLLLEQKETLEKQLADVQSQYDAAKADIELANKVGNFVDFYKENDNFPDPE